MGKAGLSAEYATLAIYCVICIALVVLGFYVIRAIRDGMNEKDNGTTGLMANFQELHSQGDLTDEEFRTIKTRLVGGSPPKLKDGNKEV